MPESKHDATNCSPTSQSDAETLASDASLRPESSQTHTPTASAPIPRSNWVDPATAATRWCPFVRHQMEQDEPASNRTGDSDVVVLEWNNCIAGGCMAWRWRNPNNSEDDLGRCGMVPS